MFIINFYLFNIGKNLLNNIYCVPLQKIHERKCIDKIIFMTKKTPDQEKLTDIIARTILHTMYNNGNLVM